MKKKVLSLLLTGVLAASMLTGCGEKAPEPADQSQAKQSSEKQEPESSSAEESTTQAEPEKDPEPVTISIGGWPTPENEQYALFEGHKEKMKELYPYITIETDEYQYEVDTFLPKAASGQLPNLYMTWFTEIDKIINAGYAEDITGTITDNGVVDAINPDLLKQVERDGKYYGIPTSAYSMSMMYNVAVFKEAGLVDENGVPLFPKTWDEVAQTAVTIKEKTGKPGFFFPTTSNQGGWMFTNLAWSYGADFEEQVDGKWTAIFDSDEAVAALQFLKDLRWKYDVLPDNTLVNLNDFQNLYGTDQVGMGLCHLNMVKGIVKGTEMSKDNFAVSTTPQGPAGKAAQLGGNVYMIAPGTTPQQQDAIMKWLTVIGESPVFTEEAMAGFEERYASFAESGIPVGPMGVRIWTSGERIEKENEILDKYTNVDMKLWNEYCEHTSENLRAEPPVNAQELYKALDAVIQEVFTNKDADPKALLTKAAADFQKDYLDKVSN